MNYIRDAGYELRGEPIKQPIDRGPGVMYSDYAESDFDREERLMREWHEEDGKGQDAARMWGIMVILGIFVWFGAIALFLTVMLD